jgi:predicted amidophosphoribosyltransferase
VVLDRLLALLAPPVCAACDEPLAREAVFCASCHATLEPPPPLPRGATASVAYGGAIGEAIRGCKYRPRVDRLRLLARLVIVRLPSVDIDCVSPVPLHRARLRERGFDQAAILAGAVARALERPLDVPLVRRVIDTPHLASLDARGRASAVGGAFVAERCRGRRVLLVDDVRTTGATIDAAADAIARAGGTAYSHVLAATPRG